MHATVPKGNMGYVQNTVPDRILIDTVLDTVAVEPTFAAFL